MNFSNHKSQSYTYAPLGSKYGNYGFVRIAGHGLGNLLFPWARSMVIAKKYGFKPIWPTWNQINTAKNPLRLIELMKRHYFGLFRVTDDYVHRYSKYNLLFRKGRIAESQFKDIVDGGDVQDKIIVFRGMQSLFDEILRDHDYVYSELIKITQQKHLASSDPIYDNAIGVHIRLGDLREPESVEILESGQVCYRLPFKWYVANLERINQIFNYRYQIHIFSDGSASQLREVLAVRNTKLVKIKSALGTLHTMSKMKLLVASASTLSMWASYFGRMPVIWFKNQCRQRLYYENPIGEQEIGLDEDFSDEFVDLLKNL